MDDKARLWELMAHFRTCMFVTLSNDGPQSRPMSPILKPDHGKIYFLASANEEKDREIADDPRVNLAFFGGENLQVSVTGKAEISKDPELKRSLWGTIAQAFMPDGPESNANIAIVVTPHSAAFWEGNNAVVQLAKIGLALATQKEANVGDVSKVRL